MVEIKVEYDACDSASVSLLQLSVLSPWHGQNRAGLTRRKSQAPVVFWQLYERHTTCEASRIAAMMSTLMVKTVIQSHIGSADVQILNSFESRNTSISASEPVISATEKPRDLAALDASWLCVIPFERCIAVLCVRGRILSAVLQRLVSLHTCCVSSASC